MASAISTCKGRAAPRGAVVVVEAGEEEGEEEAEEAEAEAGPSEATVELRVELLSVTGEDSSIALSTLRMTGGGAHGRLSGRLAHMLRVAGHPVVGDRFARRERVALPRSCGPLKAKLQIGCYGVAAEGLEPPLGAVDAAEDPPDRLSAAHWERVVAEAERKSRPG